MNTAALTRADVRLQCRCGTNRPLRTINRILGRAKSYRLECPGCGKRSALTFYADRLTDKWNEVATR